MRKFISKILSFNIRTDNPKDDVNSWANRKTAVVDYINSQDASVIFLQEVKQNQFSFIAENLAKKWAIVWYPRDVADTEGLAIVYDKTVYNRLSDDIFWLSETPEKISKGWGAMCFRICLRLKLKHKETGKELNLFNTHLDHRSTLARENGVKLILERAKTDDGVVIVAGDFNAKDDSECYSAISSVMKDCQKSAPKTQRKNTFHKWGEIVGEKAIDFIFVDKSVEPLTFTILDKDRFIDENGDKRFYSDHYAIKAKINISTEN